MGAAFGYAILKGLQGGASYAGSALQAKALKEEAKSKESQAAEIRYANVYNTIRHNEETRRLLGMQRQLYGQAGVTLEGTPTDVLRDTLKERTFQRLEENRRARAEVTSLWHEADTLRSAARDTRTLGYYNALFGSGGDMAGAFGAFGGRK